MNPWGEDMPNYTVKAAAKRVQRNRRTIQRWIADGMEHRVIAGMIVIDADVLMREMRARCVSNPNIKTRRDLYE